MFFNDGYFTVNKGIKRQPTVIPIMPLKDS